MGLSRPVKQLIAHRCQLLEVAEGVQYIHSQKIVHGDLRGVSFHYRPPSKTEMMRTRKISSWILIFAAKLPISA